MLKLAQEPVYAGAIKLEQFQTMALLACVCSLLLLLLILCYCFNHFQLSLEICFAASDCILCELYCPPDLAVSTVFLFLGNLAGLFICAFIVINILIVESILSFCTVFFS